MNTSTTWVAVLDIVGLTIAEYNSIIEKMGVEKNPAANIYLHIAAPLDGDTGIRVIELWDNKEGFESFIQQRMMPAAQELGIQRDTKVTLTPLHNAFSPRLTEIPSLPQTRQR
jgi:hypothetical protein